MVLNKRNIAAFLLSKYFILSGKVSKVDERAAQMANLFFLFIFMIPAENCSSCVKWFKRNGYFLSTDQLYNRRGRKAVSEIRSNFHCR